MPAMMLTKTIITPATASPLTNFEAPSIAPWKSASRWILRRRSRACSSVIWPAFRSASIAICLPGMASRVKRAATSATRPAPAVITTNWMTTMIRKITMPTITLPPTTKLPKAWITLPASPCSRISLVTEMLIARRNSVVNSRSDGNEESSRASSVYIETITRTSATVMFSVMKMSSSISGSGRIIIATTATTATAVERSECLRSRPKTPDWRVRSMVLM